MIKLDESMFYSKGNYYLMEHWRKDGRNIYSKAKHQDRDHFFKSYKDYLTEEHIKAIDNGENVLIKQPNGTTLFFKHCNF